MSRWFERESKTNKLKKQIKDLKAEIQDLKAELGFSGFEKTFDSQPEEEQEISRIKLDLKFANLALEEVTRLNTLLSSKLKEVEKNFETQKEMSKQLSDTLMSVTNAYSFQVLERDIMNSDKLCIQIADKQDIGVWAVLCKGPPEYILSPKVEYKKPVKRRQTNMGRILVPKK